MKLFFLACTFAAASFTNRSFASDGSAITPQVLHSFETTFTGAKNADWTVTEHLFKVQFALNEQYITAFYNADGSMAALTRNISPVQMPVSLQTSLKKDYKGYWVAELFELSNEDGIQYYVTLEDADNKVILRSSAATWNLYQKQHKS